MSSAANVLFHQVLIRNLCWHDLGRPPESVRHTRKFLPEKMTCLGLKKMFYKCKKFFVSVDDIFPEAGILKCLFPRGPILGAVLFFGMYDF